MRQIIVNKYKRQKQKPNPHQITNNSTTKPCAISKTQKSFRSGGKKIIVVAIVAKHLKFSFFCVNTIILGASKMDKWKGKVALVTGSSSGIGAHLTKTLAQSGMIVIGLGRRVDIIDVSVISWPMITLIQLDFYDKYFNFLCRN